MQKPAESTAGLRSKISHSEAINTAGLEGTVERNSLSGFSERATAAKQRWMWLN